MAAFVLMVVVGTSIWVGFDAQARDFSNHSVARSTFGWVAGSLALWIVVFPIYLVARTRVPLKGSRSGASAFGAPGGRYAAPVAPGPLGPPPANAKFCPECAEEVREAARKCRYCGYWFDGGPA